MDQQSVFNVAVGMGANRELFFAHLSSGSGDEWFRIQVYVVGGDPSAATCR